ncbi:endonuclease/exonuclease/phosphatase family protein [Bacterioplanoides sp.]|uniref:endonuclease/exonuclease/phosphatase family protein n=1 Tax=Bacterioplanoides sp. TaxID=2066072 RepID=UPI003AFFCBD4
MKFVAKTPFTIATLILAICSIAGFFSSAGHIPELLSHFRLQYLVGALLCLTIFALQKDTFRSLAAGLLVVINGYTIAPLYFSGIPSTSYEISENRVHKILLSNVHSSNNEHQRLINLIQQESPDVLVLLEITDAWLESLQTIQSAYPFKKAIARSDNFGIAVFSKLPFDRADVRYWGISGFPSLALQYQLAGTKTGVAKGEGITLLATHPLPPITKDMLQQRDTQLLQAAAEAAQPAGPVIMLGDFNITPWSSAFKQSAELAGLSNCRNGFGILPTWPASLTSPLLMIPIDHCLVSNHFQVVNIRTGANIGSDHLPLIIELRHL